MATLALVSVFILAICVFVLLGAVLELHKDIRQMRKVVGVLDTPTTLDIGGAIGARAGDYGLPVDLERQTSALVIFLSETCSTCQIIASSLSERVPDGLWVVLGGRDARTADVFHNRHFSALAPECRHQVIVDGESEIFGRIGLDTTPAGIRVKNGMIQKATTVPSVRYLESITPTMVDSEQSDAFVQKEQSAWAS